MANEGHGLAKRANRLDALLDGAFDVPLGINRGRSDVPLDSVDVRRALNLAVDRDQIISDGLAGYANEMPAMTPSWCSGFP